MSYELYSKLFCNYNMDIYYICKDSLECPINIVMSCIHTVNLTDSSSDEKETTQVNLYRGAEISLNYADQLYYFIP